MVTGEILFFIFCFLQPPFIGMILFSVTKQGLLVKNLYSQLRFARKKFKGARYFECAVYPRLIGRLTYDIQVLSFVLIFIVYDVDLILFYSEVVAFEVWSFQQVFLFVLYFIFFIFGLYYDIKIKNLKWNY